MLFLRDLRYLYLVDLKTNQIKERVRYSSFGVSCLREAQMEAMLMHQTFAKLDPLYLKIEFFEVYGTSMKALQDLDLRSSIKAVLEEKGLHLNKFQNAKITETKNIQISILSYLSTYAVPPIPQNDYYNSICLIELDKNGMKSRNSGLVSRLPFPRLEDYDLYPNRGYGLRNWNYDSGEAVWNFLHPPPKNINLRGLSKVATRMRCRGPADTLIDWKQG